jgi:hypothetical protein
MITKLALYQYALALAFDRHDLVSVADVGDDRVAFLDSVLTPVSNSFATKYDWHFLRRDEPLTLAVDTGVLLANQLGTGSTGFPYQYWMPPDARVVRSVHPIGVAVGATEWPFVEFAAVKADTSRARVICTTLPTYAYHATTYLTEDAFAIYTEDVDMSVDAGLALSSSEFDDALAYHLSGLLVGRYSKNAGRAAKQAQHAAMSRDIAAAATSSVGTGVRREGRYVRARRVGRFSRT